MRAEEEGRQTSNVSSLHGPRRPFLPVWLQSQLRHRENGVINGSDRDRLSRHICLEFQIQPRQTANSFDIGCLRAIYISTIKPVIVNGGEACKV